MASPVQEVKERTRAEWRGPGGNPPVNQPTPYFAGCESREKMGLYLMNCFFCEKPGTKNRDSAEIVKFFCPANGGPNIVLDNQATIGPVRSFDDLMDYGRPA
jgi:hypothetical protein